MPDYTSIAVTAIKELIGVATTFIPTPQAKDIKLLPEAELLGANSERIKLARSLIEEVKGTTTCPSCLEHLRKVEEEVDWLDKTIPNIERAERLREDLKQLLEEYQSELPMLAPLNAVSAQKVMPEPLKETSNAPSVGVHTPGSEPGGKPPSGKTFAGQTNAQYCLECVEGHTMKALTEMRHAIDRHRTAGESTEGVQEKVQGALEEISGIDKDVTGLEKAPPEVKKGLEEILDKARWLRKEYGLGGKGLTVGQGSIEDLEALRGEIQGMQTKTYQLVSKCPVCLKKKA